nr:acyltransferase [Tetrasphaera sp. F2B08]
MTGRLTWVDNLRVAAIAGVIVVHTATAYVTDIADWYYHDELDPTPVGFAVFAVPALFGAVFGLGPLFWLAGWFSAGSLHRRGPGRFVVDRLIRLGVPVAVFVFVINPLADLVGSLRREHGSFVDYLGESEFGVTWFVVALILCSTLYALLRSVRPQPLTRRPGWRSHLAAAVVITAGAVALWPTSSLLDEHLMSARPGAWLQGGVLFGLGAMAAETADGEGVPFLQRRTERAWGWATVVGGAAAIGFIASSGDAPLEDMLHEMGWRGIGFAVAYGIVSVSFTMWCLAWFRRRWTGERRWSRAAGRASYATYLMHPLVLTSLMVGLGWLALPPEAKFLLVAALGVPLCFAVGHLATVAPGLRRVL